MSLTREELSNFTIKELDSILSLKNATLYELKSIWSTLNKQEINNGSEQSKITEVKKDIELLQDMIASKKEVSNV